MKTADTWTTKVKDRPKGAPARDDIGGIVVPPELYDAYAEVTPHTRAPSPSATKGY